ncbi:MAG TPA: ferredoxin [Sporichthya sp.]|nr:ferredoxin [Sporichthya sp.]
MSVTVRMAVSVDRERCVGHGRCYVFAPDVFEPDDEGYSTVLTAEPEPRDHDSVRSAARNCPEQAVIVEEVAAE